MMRPPADTIWHACATGEEGTVCRVGRANDEVYAEWPGVATLRAHRTTGMSTLSFERDVADAWRLKLERGIVRGMLAQLRGELSLHASAVVKNDRAILFVGASGQGKSTLAATMVTRYGAALLSDDTSPILLDDEAAFVEPADAEIWLRSESRSALELPPSEAEKAPIALSNVATKRAKIAAICVLSFGEGPPTICGLRGTSVLPHLLAATVRLVVDEPSVQVGELAKLEALVQMVRVVELTRPRDLRSLDASARLIDDMFDRTAT